MPQQLELFDSHTARFAKVEEALDQGLLDIAADLAAKVGSRFDLAEGRILSAQLEELSVHLADLQDDPERMAAFAEHAESQHEPSRLTGPLRAAFFRGLHRRVAKAAEHQCQLLVRGRPAAWYWLRAEETVQAKAALEKAVLHKVALGASLLILGNLAFCKNAVGAARELYRRAFCEDPDGVLEENVADADVQTLLDEAQELALDPPAEWVPMVGYAAGLFQLPTEPQGQGGCREFHTALLAGRGSADATHRRRMKQLAPQLFKRLLDTKKL